MSDTYDGGPAFPVSSAENEYVEFGMSLRDYFAGQALAGIIYSARGDGIELGSPAQEAETAYAWADAMLKAREIGK